MRSLIALVLAIGGLPQADAQPARSPSPPGVVGPQYEHPVGAIDIPCTLRADVEARVSPTQVRAKLVLRNLDPQATTVTLRAPCPAGPIALLGLPAEFDPLHGCRRGACVAGSSTVTVTVRARGTVKLGETVLRVKGDACNPPLPLGSTFLRAEVVTEPRQLGVCSGAGVHLVRDHKTKRLRRASLIATPIPAVLPAKPPRTSPKPAPAPPPKLAPTKPCPVCAFACTNGGIPSRRTDANGCAVCGCDPPGF